MSDESHDLPPRDDDPGWQRCLAAADLDLGMRKDDDFVRPANRSRVN